MDLIQLKLKKLFFIILFIPFFQFLYGENLFTPIPLTMEVDQKKATLGKMLFSDPILSKDNTISCESCHSLQNYGVDSIPVSIGIDGKKGTRNAPSVYNSVFNFVQMWDGRADDLKAQVLLPIKAEHEMGISFEEVERKLNKHKKYKTLFQKIYNDDVKMEYIADAIAEFEKTLITPNSQFDKYLRGDKNALSKQQLRGFELFQSKGCASCHHGINLGGNLYQKLGYFTAYLPDKNDLGRYHVTNNKKDIGFFKVPSLRNITKTAPYYHHGDIESLHKTIQNMAGSQLGRLLTQKEIDDIIAFLETLTGELPNE